MTTPYAVYRQLAQGYQDRQFFYRELFCNALADDRVYDIRASVQTGTPLGNARFCEQIEKQLKYKVGQASTSNQDIYGRPVVVKPKLPLVLFNTALNNALFIIVVGLI